MQVYYLNMQLSLGRGYIKDLWICLKMSFQIILFALSGKKVLYIPHGDALENVNFAVLKQLSQSFFGKNPSNFMS